MPNTRRPGLVPAVVVCRVTMARVVDTGTAALAAQAGPHTVGASVFPLIGGSGGSASQYPYFNGSSGGGGRGAILIASDANINLSGVIVADGGAPNNAGSNVWAENGSGGGDSSTRQHRHYHVDGDPPDNWTDRLP